MSVRVELELDDGQFTTRMVHAGETVRQFQQNVNQGISSVRILSDTTGSFLGTLRDLTVTLGMARAAIENIRGVTAGWATDIIKVNAEMEKLRFLLGGMSSAADPIKDAAKQVEYLRDVAKSAPFSLKELTDTFVKMKATGIDPMTGGFKAMIDSVAAFGGTDDVMKRATIAISQMAGKGVIQMEELRQQLGEAMPRAVEIMARSMGLTTGQLIAQISKGTLEAKTALEAFFIESERTFGGAAQQQMKTFNGLVSQTHTLLQTLAMKAGDAGFFDAVKNQLKDLNDLLASSTADKMAGMLGSALTSIVGHVRSAIEWVVQFRDEIINVGEVIAIAFISKAAMGGIVSIGAMLSNLVVQTRTVSIAWTAMNSAMQMADLGRTLNIVTNGTMGLNAMGYASRFATQGLTMMGTALAFIGNVAVPVIGGLVAAAYAFGLFSDKAADAYDNLVKFGAATRAEAEAGDVYAKALEKRIDLLKQARQISRETGANDSAALGGTGDYDQDIAKAEAKLSEIKGRTVELKAEGLKRETERETRIQLDALDEQTFAVRKKYDEEAKITEAAYNLQYKAAVANRDDTAKLQADHQRDHQQRLLNNMQAEFDIMENALQANRAMQAEGNDKALLIGEKYNAEVVRRQGDLLRRIGQIQEMAMKPVEVSKDIDIGKLVEKAKARLDDLKANSAGLQAELAGVSGEYAKLAYMIEEAQAKSKYAGPISNAEIKATTDALREQQRVYDELEKQVTGQRKFDSDLNGVLLKSRERLLEAQTKGMSDLDKLSAKVASGFYSGESPINLIQKQMQGVRGASQEAEKSMIGVFGDDMQNRASGFLSIVQKIALQFGVMVDASTRLQGPAASFADRFQFTGGSYASNVMKHEGTGRNPDSSASGVGQFIESTWLAFLKEMHPEKGLLSKSEQLALRDDKSMGSEAVEWYAAKNAKRLSSAGISVDDANLYLAHFLGPDGAIAALSKASGTLLTDIPKLSAARDSNPDVFNKALTVGGLQDWARGFMGQAMTARISPTGSSSLGYLYGQVGGDGTARGKSVSEIESNNNQAAVIEAQNTLTDKEKEFALAIQKASIYQSDLNKNLGAAQSLIADGKFFSDDRDPQSARYVNLIKLAKELDKAENTAAQNRKLRQQMDTLSEKGPRDAEVDQQRIEELKRQFQSQNKFAFSNKYFQSLREGEKENESIDKALQLQQITQEKADELRQFSDGKIKRQRDIEIAETVVGENQKIQAIQASLMTADQARDYNYNREVTRLKQLLALTSDNAELRAAIEQTLAKKQEAAWKQMVASHPLAQMVKSWSDVGQNLEKGAVSWLDGAMDKIADFVTTGKANFKDFAASVSKSLASIALKAAAGSLVSKLLGLGVASTMDVGGKSFVAFRHAGGMADNFGPYKMMSNSLFSHAPRFHTGSLGNTIGGDEIPIIAKKGEQIDWPENLAKQYGGNGSSFAPTVAVTVQGSPGMTDADHERMGQNIGKAAMLHVKEMFSQTIAKEMRSGGMLKKN